MSMAVLSTLQDGIKVLNLFHTNARNLGNRMEESQHWLNVSRLVSAKQTHVLNHDGNSYVLASLCLFFFFFKLKPVWDISGLKTSLFLQLSSKCEMLSQNHKPQMGELSSSADHKEHTGNKYNLPSTMWSSQLSSNALSKY